MKLYTLLTYHGIGELRKIQKEREVFSFIFGDTKSMLERDPEVCIDISTLIYHLQDTKSNIHAAHVNLTEMTIDTTVIINAELVNSALELLPFLFSGFERYYDLEYEEDAIPPTSTHCLRRPIFKYNSVDDLNAILQYANSNDIPIATFSLANNNMRVEFERFNKSTELALVDLTSVSYAIEDNKNLVYMLEQFINYFPNIKVISQTSQVDIMLKYFPLYFEGQEPMYKLIPALTGMGEPESEGAQTAKITHLSGTAYETFIEQFDVNLIGHHYFKKRLKYALRNFIALNKAKEQKVFSIFLFGASGIGKTEVARLIANGLLDDCYLAKINFQNYSSQDALNSLIGSPAGYVGCNNGELSEKVQKSKVGVLLCDEFEKATRPVFSFFLELLEEGRFTDSMAREYDLDGHVIIFTSNIQTEAEYKKTILPELQTRFDLVCEFEEPSSEEKTQFLDLLLEKAQKKYVEQFAKIQMTKAEKQELYNFDYLSLSALRDIKRVFNNRLMDFFNAKGL